MIDCGKNIVSISPYEQNRKKNYKHDSITGNYGSAKIKIISEFQSQFEKKGIYQPPVWNFGYNNKRARIQLGTDKPDY